MKFQCVEMSLERKPADDRPLLKSGEFGVGTFGQLDVAEFPSAEFAHQAGEAATNRRADSKIWIVGEPATRLMRESAHG